MLVKWLGVILVVVVVLWLVRSRAAAKRVAPSAPPQALRGQPAKRPSGPQTIVACTHCQIHLPLDETFMGPDGRPYCSEAHRIAHVSDPGRKGAPRP